MSAADAVRLINREKAVLIDISEPAEYAAGACRRREERAAGHARDLARAAEEQVAAAGRRLPDRQSRAPRAVAVLKKLGYENTRVLAGGLAAWRAANLPVEKAARVSGRAREDPNEHA